ncbi:MAG: ECF transporter S component [Christensenellales bacterium]|jgi:uncharacterized membrane protein
MLRRFLPYILIVFLVLLDTSVVPLLFTSVYALPATMLFVMCLGLLLGRTHGMLGGLLGGLLIDILVGYPLGYMTLAYIACGYVAGLIGYDSDEDRAQDAYSRPWALARRFGAVLFMLTLFELVTMVYQYFHTALFSAAFLSRAFARAVIGAAIVNALYYPLTYALIGKTDARVHIGRKREVKNL